ncbi:hypothetical protein N7505_004153 [Penicillium chrysogenum]|uniref:Integrase zinc-binding domain-containing protein n=1 Tax=Penicillium chrysogenum TaxID=5076 RepID=A0ABQ8WS86_PENCH|nr:hypothetical protein N7505_004153 [Penicillium chrysogenum]
MALEVLHLADKRGPILTLEVGGVVFLVLVLMRTLSLVYWYIKLRALLKLDPDGRYDNDTRWTVIDTLTDMEVSQDPMKARLPYSLDDEGLLYFHPSDAEPSLCLPKSMTKKIFALVHDDQGHQGFEAAWYKLHGLTFYKGAKLLKNYITHCPVCTEHALSATQSDGRGVLSWGGWGLRGPPV